MDEKYRLKLEKLGLPLDFIEKIPGGYHVCEDNLEKGFPFVYVSDRFLEILGWTRKEIAERFDNCFRSMVHPNDWPKDRSNITDRVFRLMGKNGYRWVSGTAKGIVIDGKIYVQGNIAEVTHFVEKMAKADAEYASLSKDERKQSAIIGSLDSIFSSMDLVDVEENSLQKLFADGNRAYGLGQKVNAAEDLLQKVKNMVHEEHQSMMLDFVNVSTVSERLKDKTIVTQTFLDHDKNWFRCAIFLVNRNQWGDAKMVIYAVRPITAEMNALESRQRKLEEALREKDVVNASLQEASKAKTDFLFNMSHDIRTPMNAVIGFTELLKKHLDDKAMAQRYVDKIQSSSEFLLSLINNVLEMARIESGKEHLDESVCEVHDFQKSLFSIFEVLVKEKRLSFTKSVEISHGNVWADVTKVREILLNIMSNAVKYTPEGGSIKFTLAEMSSDRPGYAVYKTVIEDSGIGMSKEFLPQLFDEFARERSSTTSGVIGTGLGMPIVKKLVDLMGGTIEVESELGVGSKFTVVLPFRIAEFSDAAFDLGDTLQINPDVFKGKRILLAEDNDLNAEIALSILKEEGFLVERAVDGVACVSMLEQAPEGYFDLVLMDVQMPNMDGYKATGIIRRLPDSKKANIPIIAMTANAFEEDRKNAFRMGMNAHLSKPIQVDKLIKTLGLIITQTAYGDGAYKHWRDMFVECEPFVKFENSHKEQGRPCGCLVYEAFGNETILYADETFIRIFGCDDFDDFNNYVKGSFKTIVYKEDIDRVESEITEQIKDSSNNIDHVKYRIVRKDGTIRQIDDIGRKLYVENGKAVFFVLIADLGE